MADRSHLSIGEVLSLLQGEFPDVTISKIRFLESQGLLDPERTPSGYRKFYDPDVDQLRWVLTQQREHFLPLKVIKERLDSWLAEGARPPVPGGDEAGGPDTEGGAPGGGTGDGDLAGPDRGSEPTPGRGPATGPGAERSPTSARTGQPEPQRAEPIWMADAAARAARTTAGDDQTREETLPFGAATSDHGDRSDDRADPQEDHPGAADEAATTADPTSPAELATPEPSAATAAVTAPDMARAGEEGQALPAADTGARTSPLDGGPSSVSLTIEELATASGLSQARLADLEHFDLIEGRVIGNVTFYDGNALVIAQKSAGLLSHGIEPRHLRMFKVAADREAGFFAQLVMPTVKQRGANAREDARGTLGDLAALSQSLRAALLRHALRDYLT